MRDTMEQPSNAERFIIAFAKIERSLNEITRRPKYVPFKTNARVAARYNAVVSNHLEELNTFAELRNPMVHQRDNKDEILAQPTDAVTESIERIAELLQKDQSVITYATSPVISCQTEDKLSDVVACMDERKFHRLPVYSDGKFMGVLNTQDVIHFILSHDIQSEKVSDILDEASKESVLFLKKDTLLKKMTKMFEDFISQNHLEPVVLVTETGHYDEPPLGIITPTDMVRIVSSLA